MISEPSHEKTSIYMWVATYLWLDPCLMAANATLSGASNCYTGFFFMRIILMITLGDMLIY